MLLSDIFVMCLHVLTVLLWCLLLGGTELQLVTTETSLTIAQLTPNTNYSFYVLAYNEKNPSPKSAYSYFRTDDGSKYYIDDNNI